MKRFLSNLCSSTLMVCVTAITQSGLQAQSQSASSCDRSCLSGMVDTYVSAMVAHDPSKLPVASGVRFTENNVALKLGDGLWGTIDGMGSYKLYFADPEKGQVGFYGVVIEYNHPALYSLRLKVTDHRISEVETIVVRQRPNFDPAKMVDKPVFLQDTPPDQRLSRADLIKYANTYFDTLQLNDGILKAKFDPLCNRVENGTQTTNNPDLGKGRPLGTFSAASLGCADEFRTGFFRFVTRIRDRRFLVVDQQRSLVFASAFFDHEGRMRTVKLTDGREVPTQFYSPWTWQIGELFKVEHDGTLRQIEALVLAAPYNVPSVWNTWDEK